MFRKIPFFAFLFFGVIGLGLSGCDTMEGAGRDVQSAGSALEDAAAD